MGTGSSFVLRETTISVSNTRECGASSDNMICAGQMYPQLHDSCQVKNKFNFIQNERLN